MSFLPHHTHLPPRTHIRYAETPVYQPRKDLDGDGNTSFQKDTSHEKEQTISRESSRGVIKLGAKIRNVSSYELGIDTYKSKLDDECLKSHIFSNSHSKTVESTAEKNQIDLASNLKLIFKRTDSSDVNSAKTDSPRISAFTDTAHRLNAVKLSTGDTDRIIEPGNRKITMEALLLEDRERLQKAVKEKSLQVFNLNKTLAQERKSTQLKVRQLELQIQMLKYTHQQTTNSFNTKIDTLKKENEMKDSLITQLAKEIKELQFNKNQQTVELIKLKDGHKKEVEECKQKFIKVEIDLRYSSATIDSMKEEKVKLESIIRDLNTKLLASKVPRPWQQSPRGCQCSTNNTLQQSLEKQKNAVQSRPDQKLIETPRKTVFLTKIHERTKDEEIQIKRETILQQQKCIKDLQTSTQESKNKIDCLNKLVDEYSQELIKERVKRSNQIFKHRY